MTERIEFTLDFKYENGQQVNITVDYEEGQVMGALNAIREAGNDIYLTQLLVAHADDPSVRAALDEMGVGFVDDYEDY